MNKNKIYLLLIIIAAFGLRFYQLGKNPPGIYWDEAAIGIDAYTLSKTLRDQYGRSWLQPIFPSYGDYKAPVYIWLAGLSVKFFGLNEFAVRFPSAFFGSLTVLLIYFLVKELFKKSQLSNVTSHLSLISALLLAITPWHVHFSRIGFESSLSLFWLALSLFLFLKGIKKGVFFPASSLAGAMAVYSYFSARVVLPMIILFLLGVFIKEIWQKKIWALGSIFIFIVLLLPLLRSPLYPASQQLRMSTKNIFLNSRIIDYSSRLLEEDHSSFLGRVLHHRYYYLGREFLENYFSHFTPHFLFLEGDSNLRHHTGFGGQLLFVFFPILIIGAYGALRNFNKSFLFLFIWLLFSPIAASVPYEVPHASRAIAMVIPLVILCAFGFCQAERLINEKGKAVLLFALCSLLFANFMLYAHDYLSHYPNRSCQDWQDGYKELMSYLRGTEAGYEKIYVSEKYRLPYLYLYFYFQPRAEEIQLGQTAQLELDPLNFGEPQQIGRFYLSEKKTGTDMEKSLYVFGSEALGREHLKFKKQINFVNQEPAFFIFEN